MAVPKSKISNSRRGMRRSHLRLKGKNFIEDKESGEMRLPHHVDMTTGTYMCLCSVYERSTSCTMPYRFVGPLASKVMCGGTIVHTYVYSCM